MQNLPTTNAAVANQTTTVAGVLSPIVTTATPDNQSTAVVTVTAPDISTARVEGLWMSFNLPWEMTEPWSYVSLVQSNTLVTNL